MKGSATPPAWYRDPADDRVERWWDGRSWTAATRPVGPVDYLWGTGAPSAPAPPLLRPRRRRGRVALIVAAGLVVVAAAVGTLAAAAGALAPARDGSVAAPQADSGASAAAPTATSTEQPSTDASASPTAVPAARDAVAVLATLVVKGPSPMTGYARAADFGTPWLDVDRNGCDTRNDILRRDLTATTGAGCRVTSGVLDDPYTRKRIAFRRGNDTSLAVQIDHVVALADAWRTGAQRLTQQERVELAGDPTNLFAVDGPINDLKGDGDAATWLPPNRSFRCTYVAHQIAVKQAYSLWVTPAEHDAMARVLARCPSTEVPVSTTRASVETTSPSPAASAQAETPPVKDDATAAPSGALDARYRYCTDVKRAGAHTPYVRGKDPEYEWYRDADGDGVVCE